MHKLISTKFIHYDDYYTNYKEYNVRGIDNCTVPNPEWMNEMGNKYYFICEPQTSKRKKVEVAYGEIIRDTYGYPKIAVKYLDKPFNFSWASFFPAYCWGTAFTFMGIKMTEDNKLSCLVFDNEEEARDFCNRYNEWKENKNQQDVENSLKSDNSVKRHTNRLSKIKDFVNSIDVTDIHNYWTIDIMYESVAKKLKWQED